MSEIQTQGISVVVPAFNEAERIAPTLVRMCEYLDAGELSSDYEVLVVDDGSTDETAAVVEGVAVRHAQVRLIEAPCNQGKGAAVRLGALASQYAMVIFSDADLSTPIEEIEVMVPLLEAGADVVIASREHAESQISVDQKPVRKNMGRTFNRVVRLTNGLEPHDTQCGFKGFRRKVARKIFERTRIDGFAFDVEVLVIARALGLKVAEVPVVWNNSPDSRVHIVMHSLQMLRDLMRIRHYDRSGAYGNPSSW